MCSHLGTKEVIYSGDNAPFWRDFLPTGQGELIQLNKSGRLRKLKANRQSRGLRESVSLGEVREPEVPGDPILRGQ